MNAEREKFLLFRVRRFNDAQAFKELHAHHEPRILRFLGFKLPGRNDAEDLTNEVFIRAWDYMRESQVENFGALIYQIARGCCADFYRKRSRQPEVSLDEAAELSNESAEQMVNEVSTVLSIDEVIKNLGKLKDEYRDVIIMRYVDEMSVAEIAKILEKSENNVRVTIHRALAVIRRIMDNQIYDHNTPNDFRAETTP